MQHLPLNLESSRSCGLCQVPRLQEPAAAALWGKLLQAALALQAQAASGATSPEDDIVDVEEFAGAPFSLCFDAHQR